METKKKGKVWLVGAGPGDPGLITVKGRAVLEQAEVVLFDKLVGYGILPLVSPEAEWIDVGKLPGNHTLPQEEINRILLEKALLGKRVVRLKGGDPFLFGRGGEELELLSENRVEFEVVPGITSATAVPAYFGIPVTHRDYCSSIHIITGHPGKSKEREIPYEALVKTEGTLLFLMGVSALPDICKGLTAAGMDPCTPAAVLESGTTAKQRKLLAPLGSLAEKAKEAGMKAPSVIVIGKVCELSRRFSWMEKLPLAGVRIGVARPRNRASVLMEKLSALGAEAVALPAIRIEPREETPGLKAALLALSAKDWLAFTSPAGAELFFTKLREYGMDIRTLLGIRFAVIGSATAEVLLDKGIIPDLVPSIYSGKALGEALAKQALPDAKIVLPRARMGTEAVLLPLKERNLTYLDIPLYDTKKETSAMPLIHRMVKDRELEWAAFTSASTVEGFAAACMGEREALAGIKALCIGGQTAKAAEKYNMKTYIAKEATMDSMAERLIEEVLQNGIKGTL